MSLVLIVILVLGLLIVGGLVVGAVALAASSNKSAKKNAAIPGIDIVVPQEWTLGHDPEARLHRRIAAAVSALDQTIGQTGVADLELRAGLMNDAANLDRTLVSIWALPRDAKPAALADVEPRIAALEAAATRQALHPDADRPRITDTPTLPPLPDPPLPNPPQAADPTSVRRTEPEQPA